jgi:hypothetical protein
VDAQQRRPPGGQAEQPLEADGAVEVAADVEQALREGFDARQLAAAQAQPRLGVRPDHDVRAAAGDALADARTELGAADLPGVAHVAQPHVVGHVRSRMAAQIALGQRAESVLDEAQPAPRPSHGGHLTHPGGHQAGQPLS